MDQFYLHLSSGGSQEFYPANESNNFTNQLPIPLEIKKDEYVVGIKELYMRDLYDASKKVLPPVKKTFFGNSDKDNVLKARLYQSTTEYFAVHQGRDFISFVDMINVALSSNLPTIKIVFKYLHMGDNVMRMEILFAPPEAEGKLHISEKLAKLFSLNMEYEAGTHIANIDADLAFYASETFGDRDLSISYSHIIQRHIVLSEPKEYTLQELALSMALDVRTQQKFNIQLVFEPYLGQTRLDFRIRTPGTTFQFPPQINEIFGKAPEYIFQGQTTFLIIPEFNKPGHDPHQSDQIFILADCIEPEIYNNKYLPLLRIISREVSDSDVHLEFSSVQYKPAKRQDLKSIRIQLVDERLNLIPTVKWQTTAVLHFLRNSNKR